MHPTIFGFSSYVLLWVVAAILSIAEGYRLVAGAGFERRRSLLALTLIALAIVAGAKLLFLAEHLVFADDDPIPGGATFGRLLRYGFRLPGGVLLMGLMLPLITRRLGLHTLRFADAFMPTLGIAVVFTRIGCFLHGCCFGARTDGPLGVSFPPGARVYEYQLLQHEIAGPAPSTLPVHPLQLYFVALGILMYVMGRYWQKTKRFDGEVWANTFILFFAGTFLLELVRATTFRLNLLLAAAAVATTLHFWRSGHRAAKIA